MSVPRLTIDDIARLAGVSRTTASMVLNGRGDRYRIAEATQARVRAVAEAHSFQPSVQARALRTGFSQTLGLVVPELTNFAHASLAQAIEPLAHAAGYQALIVTSNDEAAEERAGVEHLLARQVDGLLVVPCMPEACPYAEWQRRVPLYLVDRRVDGSGVEAMVTNAESAVSEMLGDALRGGREEAFYFGGQPHLSPSIDRLRGFRSALAKAGLDEQPEWVTARDYRRRSGYDMMRECYDRLGRYPRVLFCGAITLLEGVLEFINQQDRFRRAPERIVTFDDHYLLDCLPLPIDAIAQDSHGLAASSLVQLQRLMAGEAAVSGEVPARLIWRSRRGSA